MFVLIAHDKAPFIEGVAAGTVKHTQATFDYSFLVVKVDYICHGFHSPLGDETYNASSTNMRKVMNYLYIKNKVFDKEYKSMRYKGNISSDIIQVLNKNE